MAAIRCSAILATLLAAGCTSDPPTDDGAQRNAFDPAVLVAPAACESRRFEGALFTICPFDTGKDRIEIKVHGADGRPLRSFAALGDSLGTEARAELRFAINGGMYDEDGEPIGLFVDRGRMAKPLNLRRGYGNFHLLPNGVFAVDAAGRVSVTPSPQFVRAVPRPVWATQSGPMLVIGGKLHPAFDSDGESRLVRNGVGVAGDRRGYFAISEQGVSFGRFARLFRDALGCRDALFLDGSVSSLWDPAAGRKDPYAALGPFILVSRRKD